MGENKNKGVPYYITTAIAYTSGKPHIGNTYEIVLADAIARFKREQGYDVRFQTGTDEHGLKIEQKAEAAGVTPQQFVDNVAGEIKRIWTMCNPWLIKIRIISRLISGRNWVISYMLTRTVMGNLILTTGLRLVMATCPVSLLALILAWLGITLILACVSKVWVITRFIIITRRSAL